MRQLPYWTALIAVLALLPGAALAQQPEQTTGWDFRFERLDGLSHNTVLSLIQDSLGFLWVGTPDGLNRFDGYEFRVYRHDPHDSTSLSNNNVKSLLQDNHGHLWIGTDRGLDRFDYETGRFIRYLLDSPPANANSVRHPILHLEEDRDGRLWVAGRGLYRHEPETDRFVAYVHDPDDATSLSSDGITSLYFGRDGSLWVGTADGVLNRYDAEHDRFERFDLPGSWSHPLIAYEEDGGLLWITEGDKSTAFDLGDKRFTDLPSGLPEGILGDVIVDRSGNRWIAARDGVYRSGPDQNRYGRVPVDPAEGSFLQNSVMVLLEDAAGTLWAGTLSGLYRLDPNLKAFRNVEHNPGDTKSLSSSTVMAVTEDEHGTLWIGTLGGGLNRLDPASQTVERLADQGGRSSRCGDLVWSLFADQRGMIWLGTDDGLCAYDARTGRFTRYRLLSSRNQEDEPAINAFARTDDDRVWIGSNAGLFAVRPSTGEVSHFEPPSSTFVQSLYVDQSGTLWVGTFFGRLYSFDPHEQTFIQFPLVLTGEQELFSEGIWAIHEREQEAGILWLGSDVGLTRADTRTGEISHVGQRDGLPGSIVYAILEDESGRLWLSTNHGLARFDPSGREEIAVFDAGDGLRNTEFNRRAAGRARDGTLYFGGLQGLTWFHPEAIQTNPFEPPVVITRIETSNRDTTVSVNPFGLEELVLSYRDYTVSFEFAALSFTNPSRNRYRYQMEGLDDGWIDAGTRRFARYTNLPAGRYTFRVLGSNNDGVWSEDGASMRITVEPPFWQTWWFRVILAGMVVGVLTAAYRLRVAHLIAIERMRLRIAGDLHDEIGSNLSSIAVLSDMIRGRERLGEREHRHLARIGESARSMIDGLRDIVWSIDPEKDRLADLVDRMRETASILVPDMAHSFRVSDEAETAVLDMNARRHILLIYKEALHNVVRHAKATTVVTEITATDGVFMLKVSDNGRGFDANAVLSGAGLKSLRDRAAVVGGDLTIESIAGNGTTVRLTVPRDRAGALSMLNRRPKNGANTS